MVLICPSKKKGKAREAKGGFGGDFRKYRPAARAGCRASGVCHLHGGCSNVLSVPDRLHQACQTQSQTRPKLKIYRVN